MAKQAYHTKHLTKHDLSIKAEGKIRATYFENIKDGAANTTLEVLFDDPEVWQDLRRYLGDRESPSLITQLRSLCSQRRLDIAARKYEPIPLFARLMSKAAREAAVTKKLALVDGEDGIDHKLAELEARERELSLAGDAAAIDQWTDFKTELIDLVTTCELRNAEIAARNRHIRLGDTHKMFQSMRFLIDDYQPPLRTVSRMPNAAQDSTCYSITREDQGHLPTTEQPGPGEFRYHISAERLLGRELTEEELLALRDKLNQHADDDKKIKDIQSRSGWHSSFIVRAYHAAKQNLPHTIIGFLVGTFIILAFTLPALTSALGTAWLVNKFAAFTHFSWYATTILMILATFAVLSGIARAIFPGPGGPQHTQARKAKYFVGTRAGVLSDNPLIYNPVRRLWRGLKGFFSWFHIHGLRNPTAMTLYGVIYGVGLADVMTPILPGPIHAANMWAVKGLANIDAGLGTKIIGAASVGFFWGKLSLLVHNTIEEVERGWLSNTFRWFRRNYINMIIIFGLLAFGTTIELGIPFLVAHIGAWFWFNCITLNIKPGVMVLETIQNPRESIVGSTILLVPTVGVMLGRGKLVQLATHIWNLAVDAVFEAIKLPIFGIVYPVINVVYECLIQNTFKLLAWVGLTRAAMAVARARIAINKTVLKAGYQLDAAAQKLRLQCTFGNVMVTGLTIYSALALGSTVSFLTNGSSLGIAPIAALAAHFHLNTAAVCSALICLAFGMLAYTAIRLTTPTAIVTKLNHCLNKSERQQQAKRITPNNQRFHWARKYLPASVIWGSTLLTLLSYQASGMSLAASGVVPLILMCAAVAAFSAGCIYLLRNRQDFRLEVVSYPTAPKPSDSDQPAEAVTPPSSPVNTFRSPAPRGIY